MAKARPQPDVLVLGSHPCCYFAAALLHEAQINAVHATLPGEPSHERLVLISPKFFELHKLAGAIKKSLDLSPVYGLKFLADDGATSSEYADKSIGGHIGCFKQVRSAMLDQARRAKVSLIESKTLEIRGLDEGGVDVVINGAAMRFKMLIIGAELGGANRKILGLPEGWDAGVLHRYTFLRLKGAKCIDPSPNPTIPMSLDLGGQLHWAWLLATEDEVQIAVEQPIESTQKLPPKNHLARWIDILTKHKVLKPGARPIDASAAESIDLPFAGALSQEGVANRTLLIGPAGGFLTACAEDIYPNCWSAMFAADVAKDALKQRHLQDALGAYREKWGATLGDYLRGPQENLRFLLPLVYRNPVMTSRMGEAILLGASVVR